MDKFNGNVPTLSAYIRVHVNAFYLDSLHLFYNTTHLLEMQFFVFKVSSTKGKWKGLPNIAFSCYRNCILQVNYI